MSVDLQILENPVSLDPRHIPEHIAIIMDGNRRWAKGQNLPSSVGHWKGAETLMQVVDYAVKLGVKTLTVYSFSTENWGRSKEEIDSLMELFEVYLIKQRDRLVKEGVCVNTIGDLSRFPSSVIKTLEDTKEATKNGQKIELILALGYGARDEICRAMNRIIHDHDKGMLKGKKVTEEILSSYLDTSEKQDPDLLIRTGGRLRLSNFLLWQVAYTEVFVSNVLWPDFSQEDFLEAIADYQGRVRRYGQ